MDRKRFVRTAALTAGALAAKGASAQADANRVPMEVEIFPSWLTWVTATTGCLRALEVDVDNVDVAGHSGYAFHMCVTDVVGVEGPTVLPWNELARGARWMGRSTLDFEMGAMGSDEDWEDGEIACFDLAKREVDLGRPCVVWGTGIPEFGIVVGYEGEEYIYRWAAHPDEDQRTGYRELQDPGGPYLLGFPSGTTAAPRLADRFAVINALNFLRREWGSPNERFGLKAYDQWISALRGGRATGYGNSYCAQCYRDGKQFAAQFVGRVRDRNPFAADPLSLAADAYATCAKAMRSVAECFPFPDEREIAEGEAVIKQACEALATARDAETGAAEAIDEALMMDWETT